MRSAVLKWPVTDAAVAQPASQAGPLGLFNTTSDKGLNPMGERLSYPIATEKTAILK